MKNLKRTLSMLLALLMLLSTVPMMATAQDMGGSSASTSGSEVIYYDFELEKTDFVTTNNKKFAGESLNGKYVVPAIEELYNNAEIDWKYATNNQALLREAGMSSASAMMYFGGTSSYKWSGFRAGVKNGSDYPAGLWVALNIRVPFAGKYNLSLDHMTRKSDGALGEVYLIEGGYNDAATIEAKMNEDTLVAEVDCSSNDAAINPATADLGSVDLKIGQYTIVFKAAEKIGGGGCYFYLRSLTATLLEKDPSGTKVDGPTTDVTGPSYVPGAFTADSFEVAYSDLKNTDGKSFAAGALTDSKNLNALNTAYTAGTVSWKYAADNIASFTTSKITASNLYAFGGEGNAWAGLRLGMQFRQAGRTDRFPAGYWTAFTVKIPAAGNYKITLDYQKNAESTPMAEAYILPGALTDSAAIDALLTRDNMRAGINMQGRSYSFGKPDTGDLGVMNLAAGEYTFVLKAAKIGKNTAYMYINGLHFTATDAAEYKPTLPPVETPVVVNPVDYSFELGGSNMVNLNEGALAGANLADFVNRDALDEYYEKGLIKWKYAADNAASLGSGASAVHTIGQTSSYPWTGIRFGVQAQESGKKTYPAGWWTALNFKAPATGTKYLYLDYQMCANSTPCAEIYVLKGALTDAKAIEKQLTKANLLKVLDMKSDSLSVFTDKSSYIGKVNFSAGEYTLVVRAVDDSGNNGAYIYMNALRFENEAPPAPSKVTYNFDLSKTDGGIYQTGTKLMDKVDDLQKRYDRGLLNWCYWEKDISLGDGGHAFNRAYGMAMYTMHDQWMAFKIQSPGEGLYTLTLNHGLGGRGALGAIYILPGNTTDIGAAMDHGNRVGKVVFYNDDGNVQVSSPHSTVMATFDFEADQEYIMVVEAYADTPYYRNNGYMWISSLVAEKGDHMVESEGNRRVQAVVVDPEPCKTMEPTIALAAAEIDGQDYLFMPTEGRALYVFNLEDGVMVRKVTGTPFPICRGITVDKDGIVWAVGDAQVLWRYDPRTNTSITSRNYKLSGGITDAGCGYAMTTDDEGNIYFGTNPSACIVKYNPQTDEFSMVGGRLGGDDGDYANVPIIKDGFLYATVAGDKNGDGKMTAYAYKIDLATNKIVAQVNITEPYGETEVMVRGGGICGDTLFFGGISMKSYVAIDINTMELKDYGDQIYGSIGYSPTPEIDGKCYMVIGGVMHMYDSATDSFTRISGMETANVGFRPTGLSAVTLSNNPLFPGISYVTYTSTGPKYYNMQTKQVTTPALYDEDKEGSGQIVRVVVSGEEGDNNIYVGGYNTVNCAIINTDTGVTSHFKATSSQTDALLWYEGVLYAGNYNAGNAVRINLEDERRNVILQSFKSLYEQSRVHALAAGDGMLFIGTIPDSFLFGGCLGVTDLDTLQTYVVRDLIPGQCITTLAYDEKNGVLFGGTSRSGGTGASRPESEKEKISAVIFAYDPVTKEKLAELDLRKSFPELAAVNPTLDYIDGIAADPNVAENGRIWGMIGEILFYFTYNEATKTFKVTKVLDYGYTMPTNISRGWDAIPFDFDDEGYIYAAFHTTGGMRKINMANPSDNVRLNCEVPKTFCLGNDGNLYYATGLAEVKMLPLNVQEEDWQAAEAVDAKINALGPASLETEAAIKEARAAYNALNLGRRALTQSYDKLLMAETDLLECKIDAIGEVTLDKEDLVKELLATYEALPAKEKKYVKNYSVLNAADIAIQNEVNMAAAKKVQKILDDGLKALGTIDLEDETAIAALRAEYDKLTFAQRLLVNAKGLEAAEAAVKALRQEKIDYLQKLIESIGEVTLEDEAVIIEAMGIYNDFLRIDERAQVDNTVLLAANKALLALQKEAAAKVDALITAIGDTIDHSSKDAIEAARKAYDALTPGAQKLVKNLAILTEAEALFAALGMNPKTIILIVAIAGGVLLAAAAVVVVLLVLKKKKAAAVTAEAEDAEQEEEPTAEPEA